MTNQEPKQYEILVPLATKQYQGRSTKKLFNLAYSIYRYLHQPDYPHILYYYSVNQINAIPEHIWQRAATTYQQKGLQS
jgi:hypothetical protein